MAKGIVLPKDYFLTRDKNGVYHWYEEDPLKSKDRQKAEVDIASVISETVGYGNIANPVMVHLLCARIDRSAVRTPAIFDLIQRLGNIPERDMFNTFNMGVGMSLIVSAATADRALTVLHKKGVDAYVVGEIVAGEEKIVL